MTPRLARELNLPISTGRLALEPLLGDHAEHLFPILHDPRTQQWIPAPKAKSPGELRARWTIGETRWDAEAHEARLAWALRLEASGTYVGKIDANISAAAWATNVGYILAPEHWGKGYATEVVKAVVEHLFALGVRGADAYVMPGNAASIRVLERAGFEPAGSLLDDLKFSRDARGR